MYADARRLIRKIAGHHYDCTQRQSALIGVLLLVPLVAMAQMPVDNLQAFLQLFDRVAYRVADQIRRDDASAIVVKMPSNPRPEERFFYSRLVTILSDTLSLPILIEPLDSLTTMALTYQLHRCEIVYRPWPGQRVAQRLANVFVEISAYNPATRQIHFQQLWQETATDTLEQKDFSRLENPNLPFTLGRREKAEHEFRWLEAALITSATGIIIYLFYSLRSR
jgi:hypothetical protein